MKKLVVSLVALVVTIGMINTVEAAYGKRGGSENKEEHKGGKRNKGGDRRHKKDKKGEEHHEEGAHEEHVENK